MDPGWYRSLVESAPDAMILADARGRIVLVNEPTTHLFGYARDQLLGKSVESLIPERYRGRHRVNPEGYFASPRPRSMGEGLALWGLRRDGTEFPIEISLSPVKTGKNTLVAAAIRDVTERRRGEQERARYAEELERSNRDLRDFAYFASHDLRTPLRQIRQFAQLAIRRADASLDSRTREYLELMDESGAKMQTLIDDLLALSRVISQKIEFESVAIDNLLQEVEEQLSGSLHGSGATISRDALPAVKGSRSLLAQLFRNLLENAIKYRSGEPPAIRIAAHAEGAFQHFTVADNGIGIDEQERETVFGMFKRGAEQAESPGTGIGLAICRKVVEAHGGKIWVGPNEAAGSTFHFTLPSA